eukprot:358234-Chlamydomonas_euryale.AAC.9
MCLHTPVLHTTLLTHICLAHICLTHTCSHTPVLTHTCPPLQPVARPQDLDVAQLIGALPAPVSSDVVGMGTWRLAGSADPSIQLLVSRLEGSWRELLRPDLNLYPPSEWKAQGWDWCDSMDPHRELDGFAYSDVPDPAPGAEGYPRLYLENRVYCSRVFRKLHLEVGVRQDGLQVLHAVLYPRYAYDLPILAMDLVVTPAGRVSLAIVDACPVSPDLSLPPHYAATMAELQALFLTDPGNQRRIPEWGAAIFSPLCVCMTPGDGQELAGFIKYAVALHRAHLMLSHLLTPVDGDGGKGVPAAAAAASSAKAEQLLAGHRRFVEKQLENDKTARVLAAAFGAEWAHAYMREVMFDFRPGDEPPYVDAGVLQLYDYFESNPELGDLPEEVLGLQDGIDQRRAQEYLDELLAAPDASNPLLSGGGGSVEADNEEDDAARPLSSQASVSRKRAEWAMTKLYETDADFRASVDALVPEAPELLAAGLLGGALVERLRSALDGGGDGDEADDGDS